MSRKRHGQSRSSRKAKISEARLRANRENAKRSTGPRTDEGKARSSKNSLSHGIYSVLFGVYCKQECQAEMFPEYMRLRKDYRDFFRPETGPEEQLVDELVNVTWRRSQTYALREEMLKDGLARCVDRYTTQKRMEIFEKGESRLLARGSRLIRDLEFLARWRKRRKDEDDKDSNYDPATPYPELRPAPKDPAAKANPPKPAPLPPPSGIASRYPQPVTAENPGFPLDGEVIPKNAPPSRAVIYTAPQYRKPPPPVQPVAQPVAQTAMTPNPVSTLPPSQQNEPIENLIRIIPSNITPAWP